MKKQHSAITSICLYCEHAHIKRAPDAAPSFRDVLTPKEDTVLLCRYRGEVSPSDTCFRFSFDPIKYTPAKALPLPSLSEEDVIN